MAPESPAQKLAPIAFLIDDRLSREKAGILTRVAQALRHAAQIQVMYNLDEDAFIKKLQEQPYSLALVPWHKYMGWLKVENFYGINRQTGPTFAGYFADGLGPADVAGGASDHSRAVLLDFTNTSPSEAATLVASLAADARRTGLRPLHASATPVYTENWFGGQGLGFRLDTALRLPEIAKAEWAKRAPALRICLSALWSLIYEEGPGKTEITAPGASGPAAAKGPRACFQIAADAQMLSMRLCYTMPGWTPKNAIQSFWPDAARPTAAAQLLLRHADFLRVHTIGDGGDIEVVAGLVPSAPAEKAHAQMHTLWVDPVSVSLVSEVPFEAPSASAPHLKALPAVPVADAKARPPEEAAEAKQARERFVVEAANKIRDLKRLVTEREQIIQELRSGGVGTAQPLPPPDTEGLLDAFQERFFEARYQIRQFEAQIAEMEARGIEPAQLTGLKQKMLALATREREWIRKLAATIEAYRESIKGGAQQNRKKA